MTPEDLNNRKTALEDSIDSLGSWMIGFTWPVAIGLIVEFYAIFDLQWSHRWNIRIDRTGLLLVTAGVVGELVMQHKTQGKERQLRGVNAEIEHQAELRLKTADERISLLDKEAEEARLETAKAQLELKRHIDHVAVQARGRDLGKGFYGALAGKPKGSVEIWCVPDVEAFTFAVQMWRGFKEGGWAGPEPSTMRFSVDGASNPLGITPDRCFHITIAAKTLPDSHDPNTAARAISDAISAAISDRNWVYSTHSDPTLPEGSFIIIVGQK